MSKKIVDEVEKMISQMLREKETELVDITFQKEGKDKILRLYVDKIQGRITLDECAEINMLAGQMLDEADLIEEAYILEVSSPGINRVIKKEKDFIKFSGQKIDVALFQPLDGNKKYTAILKGFENGNVIIDDEEKGEIRIPLEKISKANLHFDFDK